jgi:hypothetical protein
MIILSKKTVDLLKNVVETSKLFNIQIFIIDKQGIRAQSEESYIFLYKKENLDYLEFDSLCINRLPELKNRLNFIETIDSKTSFNIALSGIKKLDSGDTIVSKLNLISKNTSLEVGCGNPAQYKLPWGVTDNNLVKFTINNESIETLVAFSRIVQNKNKVINIKNVENVIIVTSTDNESDTATHIISKSPIFLNGLTDFSFVYNINNLIPVMRGRLEIEFTLTERGILILEINGINALIFPEKIS